MSRVSVTMPRWPAYLMGAFAIACAVPAMTAPAPKPSPEDARTAARPAAQPEAAQARLDTNADGNGGIDKSAISPPADLPAATSSLG